MRHDLINTVFMFPGVGSHYTGMGAYLYHRYSMARETFEEASDTLHLDMTSLCFSKDQQQQLNRLEHAQAALVCVSVAAYRVFVQEMEFEPDAMLGYSLGEYSALCCAGAASLSDTLQLVYQRGAIVSRQAAAIDGTMAWVTNLEATVVEETCREMSTTADPVYLSAYDTPYKTSISGSHRMIRAVGEALVERGGIVIPIQMSGPFHSPWMQPAADEFKPLVHSVALRPPRIPVIANWNGRPYGDQVEEVATNLVLQLVNPVHWHSSAEYALQRGMRVAVEIGPKNVLQYLMKSLSPTLRTFTFDKEKDVLEASRGLLVQDSDYLSIMARCLTAVVAVKNRNASREEYAKYVMEPYRQIEARYEALRAAEERPLYEDAVAAIDMLKLALETKRVPVQEGNHRMQQALDYKRLKRGERQCIQK